MSYFMHSLLPFLVGNRRRRKWSSDRRPTRVFVPISSTVTDVVHNRRNAGNTVMHDIDFTWEIPNFETYQNGAYQSGSLRSAAHVATHVEPCERDTWEFNLYPGGKTIDKGAMLIQVWLKNSDYRHTIDGMLQMSVIDPRKTGKKMSIKHKHEVLRSFAIGKRLVGQGLTCKKMDSVVKYLLDEGTLKLKIHFEFVAVTDRLGNHKSGIRPSAASIMDDMKRIRGDETEAPPFSDLVLVVEGKEFKVHRNILCARSPVFKAMLSHDMVERRSGRIEIKDIDPVIMGQVLDYIYTDAVLVNRDHACDLIVAADRFDLNRLKKACELELQNMDRVTVSNTLSVYRVSRLFNLKHLSTFASVYFCQNAAAVKESSEWQEWSETNDCFLAELLAAEEDYNNPVPPRMRGGHQPLVEECIVES